MLAENPYLIESYFVSSFISGLQEDLKSMLRVLKPPTLFVAFEQVRLQEILMEVVVRKSTMSWRTNQNTIAYSQGVGKASAGNSESKAQTEGNGQKLGGYKANQAKPNRWEVKKAQGLCFKCNKKYFLGHQGNGKMLNSIEAIEEEPAMQG